MKSEKSEIFPKRHRHLRNIFCQISFIHILIRINISKVESLVNL